MISSNIVRVALLDGEPIFFDCLKLLFNQTNFVVVRSFDETLDEFEQISTLRPDVVLSDARSVEAAERLAERLQTANLAVPMVYIRLDASDTNALRLTKSPCASGFVSRTAVSATLLNALEIVSMGGTFVDPVLKAAEERLSQMENVIQFGPAGADADVGPCLSEREREVLFSVAQGYSSKETAARMGLSCKTVDTYKTRAMQKLDLPDRSSVVRYALQNDWFAGLAAELKAATCVISSGKTHLKAI
ncbi:response regulator transcription factor [Roseibium sediminicola]|uniref:Response regulator transcription factor n=1 Tax=Roseibium sediminicola TaxID=2933272 RepID=A0ABT0GXJ8_9HYPH|nr:response regulator transcription factor [Roseibium sp. CAU 1639]MCK7614168.1 response regulator transcription factor [Roseibium sp. CAU 1639]